MTRGGSVVAKVIGLSVASAFAFVGMSFAATPNEVPSATPSLVDPVSSKARSIGLRACGSLRVEGIRVRVKKSGYVSCREARSVARSIRSGGDGWTFGPHDSLLRGRWNCGEGAGGGSCQTRRGRRAAILWEIPISRFHIRGFLRQCPRKVSYAPRVSVLGISCSAAKRKARRARERWYQGTPEFFRSGGFRWHYRAVTLGVESKKEIFYGKRGSERIRSVEYFSQ